MVPGLRKVQWGLPSKSAGEMHHQKHYPTFRMGSMRGRPEFVAHRIGPLQFAGAFCMCVILIKVWTFSLPG